IQARYLQAYSGVKSATTPLGAKTPIYFAEYNDDWDFANDCCRNSPTYSPLFNSITVAQLLNSVYKGADEVPGMMIYYSAGQQTFCILAVIDTAMDCTKAATGDQAQPYPQWYTYRMIFNPSFLDLQDGGHMAASVTLSSSADSAGLIATGYYTATKDSVLIVNPTATSYSGITLQINNSGLSSPVAGFNPGGFPRNPDHFRRARLFRACRLAPLRQPNSPAVEERKTIKSSSRSSSRLDKGWAPARRGRWSFRSPASSKPVANLPPA